MEDDYCQQAKVVGFCNNGMFYGERFSKSLLRCEQMYVIYSFALFFKAQADFECAFYIASYTSPQPYAKLQLLIMITTWKHEIINRIAASQQRILEECLGPFTSCYQRIAERVSWNATFQKTSQYYVAIFYNRSVLLVLNKVRVHFPDSAKKPV